MKKAFTILMTLILVVSMHLEIAAVDSMSHKLKIVSMDDISDIKKCVLTENVGLNEIKKIDTSTLNKINTLDVSNKEKVKEIFCNLGITFIDESSKQQYIVDNINNIKSITSNISYLKVAPDGTQTLIDKNTCLAEAKRAQLKENLSYSSYGMSRNVVGGGSEDNDTYTYMRLAIGYLYLGNGIYELVGEWEWLNEPVCRFEDAFSLYALGLFWAPKNINAYEKVTRYQMRITTNGVVQFDQPVYDSSTADPTIDEDGIFYTWSLPNTTISAAQTVRCTDFMCQIWAGAMVVDFDDYTQLLALHSRYVHKKLAIFSSYSIVPEEYGVDLSFTLGIQKDIFKHYHPWNYYNDARNAGETE